MHTRMIALVGNPNSGKTTLFNALTGARQRVGNWPGVTVEKRSGWYRDGDSDVEVIDLDINPAELLNHLADREALIVVDAVRSRGLPIAAVIGGAYGADHDVLGVRHGTIHRVMAEFL